MTDLSSHHKEKSIVELSEKELLGVGTRRSCFAYPGRPEFCIKIPKGTKNGLLQQRREVKYYKKLSKRGVPVVLITRYHGSVNTTKGVGHIYDAIRDYDGRPSRQMMDYIKQEPERKDEFVAILSELENYFFDNLVIFYDLSPYNILCRKNEAGKLEPFVIDGVGDVVVIPILNLSKTLVRQKIKRRWMRMINKLRNRFDWMSAYQLKH